MTCGIYVLRFKDTDKVYVGQSINIEARYKSHITNLRTNNSSSKLQEAYSIYGVPAIEVILECEEHELDTNENEAIQIFDSFNNGFNSLETAEEMPKWKNQLVGEEGTTAIYTNKQILEAIHKMTDASLSLVEISELTGVNYATLRKISQGLQHRWVREKYPDLWETVQATRAKRIVNNTAIRTELLKSRFCAEAQGIEYPRVVSPTGEVFTIKNLSEFCRVHELQRTNFRRVLQGQRNSHNGWKVYQGTYE